MNDLETSPWTTRVPTWIAKSISSALAAMTRRRRTSRRPQHLNARLLRDIGIDAQEAAQEARRLF